MDTQIYDLSSHKLEVLPYCPLSSAPTNTGAWSNHQNVILNADQLPVKENNFCSDKTSRNLNLQ